MFAANFVDDTIPALKLTDQTAAALEWMADYKVSNLPVVSDLEYLGLISEDFIFDHQTSDSFVSDLKSGFQMISIVHDQHFLEVVKLMTTLNVSVLPVLSSSQEYIGSISKNQVISHFSKLFSLENPGGILIMEMNVNDYSLSQIAQIVESNDAKILNLFVSSNTNPMKVDVTIKINRTEISSIVKTFERYNYNIKHSIYENIFQDDLKMRYKLLMNYLNM